MSAPALMAAAIALAIACVVGGLSARLPGQHETLALWHPPAQQPAWQRPRP